MTTNTYLALSLTDDWHGFWRGPIGDWVITRGLRITMWVIAALLLTRFINWGAQRITRRLDEGFAVAGREGAVGPVVPVVVRLDGGRPVLMKRQVEDVERDALAGFRMVVRILRAF